MAKEKLKISEILFSGGFYKDSINRSYYCIFHALRSLLVHKGVDFAKHSAVIAYFQREFVKNGVFDKQLSKIVTESFTIRNNVDYADFFICSKDDAEKQLNNAAHFVTVIEDYLNKLA